jgi:hypothetical protein
MIFRGATNTNDWVFGQGKQSYLQNNDAIMANIATRLRTYWGECFFNTIYGMRWFQLLGQKEVSVILLAVKSELLQCYGVTQITDLQFSVSPNRDVSIVYFIDTIYTKNFTGSVAL